MQNSLEKVIKNAVIALTAVLALLAVFIIMKVAGQFNIVRANETNTITVEGNHEVFAAPNVAVVSFSVREENIDLKVAQAAAEKKVSAALDAVKAKGIDSKDIQTSYYNSTPIYDYNQKCGPYGCESGDRVLKGYEVNESITIKIHDINKTSDVIGVLGSAKVTDIQGPSFDIENRDELMQQAREEAIKEAKAKAKVLADDLGVRLGRIVQFYDNNQGGYPIPYYAKGGMAMDAAAEVRNQSVAPTIEQGQNQIYSSVSIVYKIK